mmetsp:Transcript_7467/g.6610  ORF Transcript_7467/g.6610 Transcript_7467/m.6610 type:complete len:137 (+) Transcript_7467:557-967(+)
MTVFIFGIKHSLTAYKAILDYCDMLSEISSGQDSLLDIHHLHLWNTVISSLEDIAKQSSAYHLNMAMYNYFLKSNEIIEEQFFNNEKQYGRKKAKEMLDSYPFNTHFEEENYGGNETVEETKEQMVTINDSVYDDV